MMGNQRNLGPLLIILTVLVVALGAYYERAGKLGEILSKFGLSAQKQAEALEVAVAGQVIDGFPVEFLTVANDTKVVESGRYKSPGLGEGEMLVTVYETRAPVSDMFAGYVNLFTDRGLEITDLGIQRGVTSIFVRGGRWSISVEMYAKRAQLTEVEVTATVIE